VLAKITSDKSVSDDTLKAVKSFTNSIYGIGTKSKAAVGMPLNKFRYKVFEKAYRIKANSKNPLDKLKGTRLRRKWNPTMRLGTNLSCKACCICCQNVVKRGLAGVSFVVGHILLINTLIRAN